MAQRSMADAALPDITPNQVSYGFVVAPAIPQQLDAFRWLTAPNRYLYPSDGSSYTAALTRLTHWIFHVDRNLAHISQRNIGQNIKNRRRFLFKGQTLHNNRERT